MATLEQYLYMLEGDTTVMAGLLLENTNVKRGLQQATAGAITYNELLDITYGEF